LHPFKNNGGVCGEFRPARQPIVEAPKSILVLACTRPISGFMYVQNPWRHIEGDGGANLSTFVSKILRLCRKFRATFM
jgi:hypothetical protein